MLSKLYIENIAIIESVLIEFSSGFTVLTGETGAGKSILIDSINAVLGERTSKDVIRTGCDKAYVSAEFSKLSDELIARLAMYDIELDEGKLLIERKITEDGSSCKINMRPVPAALVREFSSLLINIHGQHDSQGLLNNDLHYTFIDALANNKDILSEFLNLYDDVKTTKRAISKFEQELESKLINQDLYSFQINELTEASITIGEMNELKERKLLINNTTKIAEALSAAYAVICGGEEQVGLSSLISVGNKQLQIAEKYIPEIEQCTAKLAEMEYNIEDIARSIERYIDSLEVNVNEIEIIEQRLDYLNKLGKKYGETEELMLKFLADTTEKLEEIQFSDEHLQSLLKKQEEQSKLLAAAGELLSKRRYDAAKQFEQAVCAELTYLEMPSAQFVVEISPCEVSQTGLESIVFLLSANRGQAPKPLNKIASGGELSRIMLAIKNVLSKNDAVETLIFDEIDTGISGRAAIKVGAKIAETAKHKQIICVTHLAQIAARGDEHLLIKKIEQGSTTKTTVTKLDFEDRKKEIARIIGGETITEATLKSAEELLTLT